MASSALYREPCLFDEPIQVKVTGLSPRQVVTMRARLIDEKGAVFSSLATYRANGSGEIDLDRDASLGGSYVGVEPMGLLWSMCTETLPKMFQKTNSMNPQIVTFSVHDEGNRVLAEMMNERFLMGDGVSRVFVKEGNIRGVLFTPPEGPFPAVLDLCISKSEIRACLLANKGFVVFMVDLYNDKAFNGKEMQLDYFEEAMDFLKLQAKVSHKRIPYKGVGIMANSKGAIIGLSLAAFVPGVKAVVCINGRNTNSSVVVCYKKQEVLSTLMFDYIKLINPDSFFVIGRYVFKNPLAEKLKASTVPIERAKGHFLFAASEDDLHWASKAHMDGMVERLQCHGKENFESVSYPGAGHLLEPPYRPYCPSSFQGAEGTLVMMGGEPKSHAAAEVHLWKKIQDFFRTRLSCNTEQIQAKL
uniref:Acyl-coenzyme A thioesterase 1-like n=1 Tax=Amphilophus citrinellus TaxID=61819 RepID=A0A3Q0TF79_AMPCI